MTKEKVLIAAPVHPVLSEGLEHAGFELLKAADISQSSGFELIKNCVGVITSTRLQLNKALIDAAPVLRFIGRMGSGMEVIDLDYARQKNIACFASPEGNCNAVAEHALGMLLALNKRIVVSAQEVAAGKWLREENRGTELEGKTIGIIGYGHTGRAFAKKLKSCDMNILVYDKFNKPQQEEGITVCGQLDPIFEQADIISFHVPISADTFHYFDQQFLGNMQQPFVLINTSRGDVIDTPALLQGLENGRITGACLDVFEGEPLSAMPPEIRSVADLLAQKSNVVLTPHIAGYSREALYKMSNILLKRIIEHESKYTI